ncbi:MAG: MaoC family dehydratase N-terminal domain-containing protein, partial [Planctomycetes bacterium]|nr:MaoC family dehydratase N-terminal domain-containing protein [Planctomycetota bacterium]
CRMFARAVGHTDLIFYDEEHAKSKGYRSIVAPPGFLGTPAFKPAGGRPAQGQGAFGWPKPVAASALATYRRRYLGAWDRLGDMGNDGSFLGV